MNWKYVLLRFVRRSIPDSWFFVVMKLAGLDNTSESSPDEAFADWQAYAERQGLSFEGKHVYEIGSGRYAKLALRMLAAGARRVSMVDPFAVGLDDPTHQAILQADCAKLGLNFPDAIDRLQVINTDVLALPPSELDDCPDFIISKSVLEHLHDPARVLQRCYEWLRPGGVTFHIVDLRDHYFSYPYEMLTFSQNAWDRWLNPKGGFHLNRWRLPSYLDAMKQAGFAHVHYEPIVQDPDGLTAVLPRLDRSFRSVSPEVLSILMIHLYGEKDSAERE